MNQKVAIFDHDINYADNFADFMNNRDKLPFTVISFSSEQQLIHYLRDHDVELLLIDKSVDFIQLPENLKKIVLSEEQKTDGPNHYPYIYKYQSMDLIVKEILAFYYEEREENTIMAQSGKARIIGIYSPINRCSKTSFALTMGQVLSKEKKVLYLNLEEYSGFTKLIGENENGTLSDLLYFYQQKKYSIARVTSIIQTWGDLDYIPPVCYPDDLCETTAKELAELIDMIAKESFYEIIIVDVGPLGRKVNPILEQCHVIYMPIKEDAISSAKIEEFESYLTISKKERINQKIKKIKLPYDSNFERNNSHMEHLLWGGLGDYVRVLLKGQVWG